MSVEKIRNIAVIGAGLMGHGIAQVFATQGYAVTLLDIQPDVLSKAKDRVRAHLELMAERGIGTREEIGSILGRINTTLNLGEAVSGADFVVEAVSENLELKQKLFQDLDSLAAPDSILATNTSVISISEISLKARLPERIVGTHFWNPPYLIPLVEVVRGARTSPQVMDTTMELLRRAGKHPVRVNKDVPGFVGNRLQHALWREAISIVEKGIAEPQTVDEVIKMGFGIRLPVLGPLENMDLVGLDLTVAIHDYLLKHLEQSPHTSPLLKEKVEKGELGFKTRRGLYPWTPQGMGDLRKNLEEHLLEWMKREKKGKGERV